MSYVHCVRGQSHQPEQGQYKLIVSSPSDCSSSSRSTSRTQSVCDRPACPSSDIFEVTNSHNSKQEPKRESHNSFVAKRQQSSSCLGDLIFISTMNTNSPSTAAVVEGDTALPKGKVPSRIEDLAHASGDVNPLKSDPELQTLLKTLGSIKKYRKFQGWRAKFLDRLEQFLYDEGMTPAQAACHDFDSLLKKFVKMATKVQDHIQMGALSSTKKTVKAALALSEMCNSLTTVCREVEDLIPFSDREEKKRGFTKFHLGAVLIRQGFHQYITMKAIEDALTDTASKIEDVMDRQQHDLFHAYKQQVQRFCDVMSDLHLYEVMMKCLQFAEEPDDESEDPPSIEVTIQTEDGKTLRLELDPCETIGNIKNAIAAGCEIEPERQVLSFGQKELADNDKSLEDYGVTDGSVLQVRPFKVPVTVNTMDGKQIKVMVDPTNTIGDIKRQLEAEAGVPAENQKLSMNGVELVDDNNTAAFYGIQAGSELDLEPKSIQVTVEMPNGETHTMQVTMSDTRDDIKAKIEDVTGMAAPRQVLKLQGKELAGGATTASDMGVEQGSTITVEVYKVPITVNTMDGNQIKISVDPTEKLSDIKILLEEKSGVSADNQKLFLEGDELADADKTGNDYGIKAGSELDMEPKSIQVTVEMPGGETHLVALKPSDTTDAIKTKIEQQTGMAAPRQVLKLEGKTLPGGAQTAKDMGIRDGSTLAVEIRKVPITVTSTDGRQIRVLVDPTEKLWNIKVQLEDESGLAADNQKLFLAGTELADDDKTAADYGIEAGTELDLEPKSIKVSVEMPDGKSHTVGLKPSDTCANIKAKIAKATGMAAPCQVVKFQGKKLPGGSKTATDMGIKEGSELKVEVYKVPITVTTMDGREIKVMVDPGDTLRNIKVQLETESGLPADNQKLFMNADELADDNKTAADYGVDAGSELSLEPKSIMVTVEMPDGKAHNVKIKPSDTTNAIKSKIEQETGMAAPRQVLKFQGKELPKGNKTAKAMGLQDGSILSVEIYKVPITVTTIDGKQIKVQVDPTDKLADIKRQLEEDSGLSKDNQKLYMGGNELLDDNKSAADYGIRAGSELDLEPKAIQVTVEMPDGSSHIFQVKPSDTGDSIKAAISKETGMATNRQVLKFEGKTLGSKTVRDVGIRDGSVLSVSIHKIAITVRTNKGTSLELDVEPCDPIDTVKKLIQKHTGLQPKRQCLKFGPEELDNGRSTVHECEIRAGSILTVEPHMDPIIFVDIKSGTLFALDRDVVVETGALTANQNNKLDFLEAAKDSSAKEKILKVMLASPTLGVATQVVVQSLEVEDYELEEAEKVASKWGVKLKKREKNKKGEEFIFVDPKTGATGELARKKYIDMNIITPVANGKGETIEEREKDDMVYDKYISQIRNVFGIRSAT